jgi:hypothetical protein
MRQKQQAAEEKKKAEKEAEEKKKEGLSFLSFPRHLIMNLCCPRFVFFRILVDTKAKVVKQPQLEVVVNTMPHQRAKQFKAMPQQKKKT